MENTIKGNAISEFYGDFTFSGFFCIGKLTDGSYGTFDDLEDYKAYRRKEKEK